jgi:hypothetical protein
VFSESATCDIAGFAVHLDPPASRIHEPTIQQAVAVVKLKDQTDATDATGLFEAYHVAY